MTTHTTGMQAEQHALTYLKKQGLRCVAQNYSCRVGEIDLIMREGDFLVIVEVRQRSNKHYGDGADSITYAKRQKIIKTTWHYLLCHKLHERYPVRFDVVSIDGLSGAITWLKNAFTID